MRILLIGECYSDNLGDGVICETVKEILSEYFGDTAEIFLLDLTGRETWLHEMSNKCIGSNFYDEKIRAKNVKDNLDKYKDKGIDIAVFAGGQLLMEYFVQPIYTIVSTLSSWKVPISFNCCGIGKMESDTKRDLLRKILNNTNIKHITVRDHLDFFKEKYLIRNDIKVKMVHDPGILVKEYYNSTHVESEIVGLGVIHPNSCRNNGISITDGKMIDLWKEIINNLDSKGVKWQLFTNGSLNDYSFAKKLAQKLGIASKERIADRPLKPKELVRTIAKYKGIISFRLHSHIIAYSLGKLSTGFIWDEKVREFGKFTGNDKNFFQINNTEAVNRITQIMTDEHSYRSLKGPDDLLIRSIKKSVVESVKNIVG